MQLYLGGHLSWYDPQKRKRIDIHLSQPTRLFAVLENLGVPVAEIAIGTLNGESLFEFNEVIVTETDVLELFPPVGGGRNK